VAGNDDAYDIPGQTAYKRYAVDNVNNYDAGVMVLPVGSEASATVTVRVHGGYGQRTVKYTIAKQGNPPVVPLPSLTVGADVLIDAVVNVPTPTPNPQTGGYDWTVQGQYNYVTSGTSRVFGTDILPVTSYPYVNITQDSIAALSIQSQGAQGLSDELKESNAIATGGWIWPLTVFPSNLLMNPNLL